jgi:hypothetical protein
VVERPEADKAEHITKDIRADLIGIEPFYGNSETARTFLHLLCLPIILYSGRETHWIEKRSSVRFKDGTNSDAQARRGFTFGNDRHCDLKSPRVESRSRVHIKEILRASPFSQCTTSSDISCLWPFLDGIHLLAWSNIHDAYSSQRHQLLEQCQEIKTTSS